MKRGRGVMAITMTPTVRELEYGRRLRVANAVVRGSRRLGLELGELELGSILTEARRRTGLSDWGDDGFLEPLDRIVSEVRGRQEVTALARVILRRSWVRAVSNRLRLREWIARHPEVRTTRIERPIFVLGFPRTGTTLLQNLLALQPGRRGLPFWELWAPVPVHDDATLDRHVRRLTGWLLVRATYQVAPELAAVHSVDVDTLEECWPLFVNGFSVVNWELSGFGAYGDWLVSASDMVRAYREYREYLQVAVHRSPAQQLVLKCPEHLWFIDDLLEVFPDACIVWTHREPFDTLASYCSMMSLQWRTMFGRIDRARLGAFLEARLFRGIERALAARQRHGEARFFDVRFDDLVADPAGTVRAALGHFGLDAAADTEARVAQYLATHRADRRGSHTYDGTSYGLQRDRVHERFRGYAERFA